MLRWPIAAKAPSSHRGDRDEDHDLLPLRGDAGKGHDRGAHEHGDARDLGRGGKERRDRRRRAFIDVRRPHMERHRRDLEAEAGEQEDDAEDQPDAAVRGRLRDAGKAHRAGEAVNQRRAIEQHSRGQRAEHEIFKPGLGRTQLVAMARGDDIKRQAHQFEAEIERDQVGRRYQHQHAERREQDEHGIFETLLAFLFCVIERHGDRGGRADQRQDFQKSREIIDDEAAAEGRQRAFGKKQQYDAGDHQQRDRRDIDDPARVLAAKHAQHQQRHGAEPEHEFGQRAERAWEAGWRSLLSWPHLPNAAVCTALSACW